MLTAECFRDDPQGGEGEKKEARGRHEKIQSDQTSHFAAYPALNSAPIGRRPAPLRVTSQPIG